MVYFHIFHPDNAAPPEYSNRNTDYRKLHSHKGREGFCTPSLHQFKAPPSCNKAHLGEGHLEEIHLLLGSRGKEQHSC